MLTDGTMPLPEPVLTDGTMLQPILTYRHLGSVALAWGKYHRKCFKDVNHKTCVRN